MFRQLKRMSMVIILGCAGWLAHMSGDAAELTGVAKITAGGYHSCILTTAGEAKCWGSNFSGQLGDHSFTDRLTPVRVGGLTAGASSIAANGEHTCVLTAVGGVKCWGMNYFGQLGNDSTVGASLPVDVHTLASGVTAIAAGYYHNCALMQTGAVMCWGRNESGQLGDNSGIDQPIPVNVTGFASGAVAIAAGNAHTCALDSAGGVKCWGNNDSGQLGNDSVISSPTPVDVTGLASGVTAIFAGGVETCAITAAGGIKCWGANSYGQLGDHTLINRLTPVDVSGIASGAVAISVGGAHACAITAGSALKCWGWNMEGQIGDSTLSDQSTPVDVPDLSGDVIAVATGFSHSCAVTTAGRVRCWGLNYFGQLGNNDTSRRWTPKSVQGLGDGVKEIAAGLESTCALTAASGVKCWGWNADGQLGDNSLNDHWLPADVTGLQAGVQTVARGIWHRCALTTGGGVKCWGRNIVGELGDNSTTGRLTPVDVVGLASGVTAIATGSHHSCALDSSGGVRCWGQNSVGQLGDNTNADRSTSGDAIGLGAKAIAIAAGYDHTCAIVEAGGVKCWGVNGTGQLGDNSTTDRWAPVAVTGLSSGVIAIAAGGMHTCALTNAGGVKCWGWNVGGQLGDNTDVTRLMPVDVNGLASGVTAVSAGLWHTCALTAAGGVKCWGVNASGQLGDGSGWNRMTPVDVTGLAQGVVAISNGHDHTCALTATAGVKCWGNNVHGEIGDGTRTAQSAPIAVLTAEPAAPHINFATAGTGSASVSFSAPVSSGTSPITGYTVRSNPAGGIDSNAGSAALTHVVTGLTNGTSYTFTVVANNASGEGPPSNPSNSVTPATPPGAPTGVTVKAGNRQVKVTFSAPANNGGSAVIAYTVSCTSPGKATRSATGVSSPITVFGLEVNAVYSCVVVASNNVASSAASAVVVVTPLNRPDLTPLFLLLD